MSYLVGTCLVAMPGAKLGELERTVIYICGHDEKGAMGIIINQPVPSLSFAEVAAQLKLDVSIKQAVPLFHGGEFEGGRGFVLHTPSEPFGQSKLIKDEIHLTTSIDILLKIAEGQGPQKFLFALGYTGWEAGELDEEMKSNKWLTTDCDAELLFFPEASQKWPFALRRIGVNETNISSEYGSA